MNDVVTYQGGEIATASQVVAHAMRVQEIMKAVMKKDVHYGIIPGTKKNTLYKPGAEALCVAFHIAPTYQVVEERFDDGVRYRVTCSGVHQGSGRVVADGLGSSSSHEEKYKWCRAYKKEFDSTPVDRRRVVQGRDYEIMQVRVETADIENTLLKMASKRALIAMVLNALAVSDIFAQDFEDLSAKVVDMMNDDGEPEKEPRQPVQSKSAPAATADKTTGEVEETKESPPAPAGMLKLIRAKAGQAGIDEAALLKKHTLESLDTITVAVGNVILKSIAAGAEAYAA